MEESKNNNKNLYCLVLNRGYMPFDIVEWQKAITLEYLGRCQTLEYHPYITIKSPSFEWPLPIVIKVNSIRSNIIQGPPTRMMIYYRDNFRCAYCGKTLKDNEITIDHIVPKSKGGKWTWENLVTCCRECNFKKKDEIWVPVYVVPKKPNFLFPKYIKLSSIVDPFTREAWIRYIPKNMLKEMAVR